MPPDEKLPPNVIRDFEAWIRDGAIDPRTAEEGTRPPQENRLTERERWAFSKPVKPKLPPVRNQNWIQQPIDHFILAPLEEAGLAPSNAATPEQLVRRLYYDLTGLPPTPSEVQSFVKAAGEDQQQAVVSLVNELLERPTYGEKWGRHWLDCVRFADSLDARSFRSDGDINDSWRYRDWVVRSFNNDLPYSEFVRSQIAGDLLARENWNPELLVATGVYAIGTWGNGDSDKKKVHTDLIDDQVDLTSRVFLGLTLSCARCHDHKFDPLTTADYYAMAGFFFSSRIIERFNAPTAGESFLQINLLSPEVQNRTKELQAQLAEIEQQLKQELIPLTEVVRDVAGRPELISWTSGKEGLPSATLNKGEQTQRYATITLPGRAVSERVLKLR